MLYLETPAGVGFSYSANDSYYAGVDDAMTGLSSLFKSTNEVSFLTFVCLWKKQETIWCSFESGWKDSHSTEVETCSSPEKATQVTTFHNLPISWFD